jgi:hypothetical protein
MPTLSLQDDFEIPRRRGADASPSACAISSLAWLPCTTSGLPSGALIVDDVPNGTPVHRPGCTVPPMTGSFGLDFGSDSARIDFQQLGAGFGSHFWFARTRESDTEGQRLEAVGTWSLGKTIPEGQAKVFVHLPDHGAQRTWPRPCPRTPSRSGFGRFLAHGGRGPGTDEASGCWCVGHVGSRHVAVGGGVSQAPVRRRAAWAHTPSYEAPAILCRPVTHATSPRPGFNRLDSRHEP